MKKLRTFFFTFLLAIIYSNSNAQQAQAADFIGNWTGTDNSGQIYTLTMNEDQTCILKVNNVNADVKWWKLYFDASGNVVYNSNSRTTLRLISNVAASASLNQTTIGTTNSGFKTYLADAVLDLATNKLEMTVDLVDATSSVSGFGKNSVKVTLTK